MILSILLLLLGFVALIYGADRLVEGASAVAKKYKVPDIVIGLTIVAFGTSAPEMVINLMSALSGSTAMALGNVVGSNIFNVLGILGICAIMAPLAVKTNTTWIEVPLSFLSALALFVIAYDVFIDGEAINIISRSEGLLLLGFFVIFLAYTFQSMKSQDFHENESTISTPPFPILKSLLFITIGLAGLIIGGQLIVENAKFIASAMGLSDRFIALTIISIGTSLPELATSIVAVRKNNVDVAIGNVVGSNIFNAFFILGTTAVVTPIQLVASPMLDMGFNLLASLLLFVFIFTGKGRRIERWEGFILLGLYITYISLLVLSE